MSTIKRVAVFFDPRSLSDFLREGEYARSYRELGALLAQQGATFFVVHDADYRGGGTFARGLVFQDGDFVEYPEKIAPDIIYKKGEFFFEEGVAVINPPAIERLGNKGYATALFPQWFAKSIVVTCPEEVDAAFARLTSEKVVVKPLDSYGGEGVFIGTRSEARAQIPTFPFLAQEFLDSSGGIPGIIDGVHDFRLVVIAGEIVLAFVRTPPPGSLLANVARGGSTTEVPLQNIPAKVQEIFSAVDASIQQYDKRLYCIDFLLAEQKQWKLLEMDAYPALFSRERGEGFARFQEKLVALLLA